MLTPISLPRESSRLPPLFPGLIAASVWITPRMLFPATPLTSRFSPLMMPWVRVCEEAGGGSRLCEFQAVPAAPRAEAHLVESKGVAQCEDPLPDLEALARAQGDGVERLGQRLEAQDRQVLLGADAPQVRLVALVVKERDGQLGRTLGRSYDGCGYWY